MSWLSDNAGIDTGGLSTAWQQAQGASAAAAFPQLASAYASYCGQEMANETNIALAQQSRDWSEKMRSTQYQTSVADLKAAGLNPALAYQQGGAGTPSATTASVSNSLGPAVSSGFSAAIANAQIDNIAADTSVKQANADLVKAQTVNTGYDSALKNVQYNYVQAQVHNMQMNTDLTEQQIELAKRHIENAVRTGKNIDADTGVKEVDAYLRQQQIPEAVKKAAAMEGELGDIKPYLDSGLPLLNSAGRAYKYFGK